MIVMWGWPESYIFRIGALDLELPQYSSIALSFSVVPVTTSCVHARDLVGARCTDLHGAPDWSRATAMARSTRLGAESTWQDAGSCPLFLEHCLDRGSCDLTYPDWGLHLEDLASISHVSMARQDSRATSLLLHFGMSGRCPDQCHRAAMNPFHLTAGSLCPFWPCCGVGFAGIPRLSPSVGQLHDVDPLTQLSRLCESCKLEREKVRKAF